MIIWIFFGTMIVLSFLNVSANLKVESLVEEFSSEIVKIVRREKLEMEIPKQVPLSEGQKEALILSAKKSCFFSEYVVLSEYEARLQKYTRKSQVTGYALFALIFIPLLWTWFL